MLDKEKVLEYITPKTAEFEGFSSKVYKCPAGYDTIGYGRNIEVNPLSDNEKSQLNDKGEVSKAVALEWLKKDLEKCFNQAATLDWFSDLETARAGAIVDMIYNLGFKGFSGFKKFAKAMEKKDYIKAVMELEDSKWFKQVGIRARDISKIIQLGI